MMQQSVQQRQAAEFHSRIARIQDPRNMSYLDPETGIVIPKKLNNSNAGLRGTFFGLPVALILSVLVGVLAVVISRYVRFALLGMDDAEANPDVALGMDLALGTAAILALKSFLKLEGRLQGVTQAIALVAAVGLLHNAVWMFPDTFATIYSADYVAMVQGTTEPNSLLFRGASIPLPGGAAPTL